MWIMTADNKSMDCPDLIKRMLPIVDRWKQKYGEEIAKELICAYLTGVNDAITVIMTLGAAGVHVLYERLDGN